MSDPLRTRSFDLEAVTMYRAGWRVWVARALIGLAIALPVLLAITEQLLAAAVFTYVGLYLAMAGLSILNRLRVTAGLHLVRGAASGHIEVSGDSVEVSASGVHRFDRASIADGWVEPLGNEYTVILELSSRDRVIAAVQSPEEGNRILAALGLSADRHAMRVQLDGVPDQGALELSVVGLFGALLVPPILWFAADSGSMKVVSILWLLANLWLLRTVFRKLRKPVVRVGTDAVRIERPGDVVQVPMREIDAVERDLRGVRLVRRGADEVHLLCWGVAQATLADRIQQVLRGRRPAGLSEAQLANLERKGRELSAWQQALRGMTSGSGSDYRRVALEPAALLEVVEAPDASPERRIGAALAVSGRGDPHVRHRIAAAASASVDEDLRVALEQAAEGELDEEAVERAVMRWPE